MNGNSSPKHGARPIAATAPHSLLSRRTLLLGAGGTALACMGNAWILEPRWISVQRLDIPIQGLGKGWHGAQIALLSDTHCGPLTDASYIRRAVTLTNSLHPDLVLLLGDYVHRGGKYIEPGIEPFASLVAPKGIYAVLGNHDHWDGRDQTIDALARARIPTMINRSIALQRQGALLAIGGVGDFMEDVQRPDLAFSHVREDVPRILMSHNPDYAEHMPSDIRVDLLVCGHTHGGQVRVPGYGAPVLPSRYGMKYQHGLVQGPRCRVYVTRGIGTISPRVRFLCRPEITLLRLVSAHASEPTRANVIRRSCPPPA